MNTTACNLSMCCKLLLPLRRCLTRYAFVIFFRSKVEQIANLQTVTLIILNISKHAPLSIRVNRAQVQFSCFF